MKKGGECDIGLGRKWNEGTTKNNHEAKRCKKSTKIKKTHKKRRKKRKENYTNVYKATKGRPI